MAARKRATNDVGPSPEIRERVVGEAKGTCQCKDSSHMNHNNRSRPECANEMGFDNYFYNLEGKTEGSTGWIVVCWICAQQICERGGKIYR